MSTHQQSKPRRANQSITEESGRPGTWRSKVGCPAMEEPWMNKIMPALWRGSPTHFSNMKSFTLPSLVAQCASPLTAPGEVLVTSFLVISFIVHLAGAPSSRDRNIATAARANARPTHRLVLHLFVHCAKGRNVRLAARIRWFFGANQRGLVARGTTPPGHCLATNQAWPGNQEPVHPRPGRKASR